MAQEITYKASWKGVAPDCLLMLVGIGFFTIFAKIPKILCTSLTVTPKMVSGKTGVITKQSLDEPIKHITSVKVEQGALGRIFKYGTIKINTAAGSISFHYMSEPQKIKELISKVIAKNG